jgi:hypothetical protein
MQQPVDYDTGALYMYLAGWIRMVLGMPDNILINQRIDQALQRLLYIKPKIAFHGSRGYRGYGVTLQLYTFLL